MIKNICIIGAGFSGISTARTLKALNYGITVYEKEPDVGGVWAASRRYPGVNTQDSKSTYALPDYPMPDDYPEWPSGQQVQEYLQNYVDLRGLTENIQLNTEVIKATFDQNQWTITTAASQADGNIQESTELFDYLIIGNGVYSVPSIPQFPGADEFVAAGGIICHTSEFIDKKQAKDKHVLVVGYGKSSCDVANELTDTASSTTVVARQLIWKVPKMVGNVINNKHFFATRLSEALFPYVHPNGVDRFFQGIGNPLRKFILRSLQFVIEKQMKFKELDLYPNTTFEAIARSTISQVSGDFYKKFAAGELKIKKNTQIVQLNGNQAELANGEVLPADIIICGTGWRQECSFLDDQLMQKIVDEQGNFRLYRAILPVGVPRLAFNGYNSSLYTQMNCHAASLWLADYLNDGVKLPTTEQQNHSIDERLAWLEARTEGKHSKGTSMIPFTLHYVDDLLNDMGMNLTAFTRFKQWFGVVKPSDYAKILPDLQEKYKLKTDK